jgi:hypothetical protein
VLELSRIREMREALAERKSLGISRCSSVRIREWGTTLAVVVIMRVGVDAG